MRYTKKQLEEKGLFCLQCGTPRIENSGMVVMQLVHTIPANRDRGAKFIYHKNQWVCDRHKDMIHEYPYFIVKQ